MVAAFIFTQISGTEANISEIHSALHAIDGVKTVHFLAGPTDALIFIEAEDQTGLMDTVGKIRAVKGIHKTDTRIVLPM